MVTGSDDNSVKVWDLRKKGVATVVPAHTALVSTVTFDQTNRLMLTSSYDNTAKIWVSPGTTADGSL
jgi:U4/U6 small nuclear ribonucleoprotein PRP4